MTMSQRRKCRSRNTSARSKKVFAWWQYAVGVFVLLLVVGVIAYQKVIQFLHSDGFREKVTMKVSGEIGVPVEFGKMQWKGLRLKNESVDARSEGAIEKITARDISLEVDTDYLKRDVWNISDVVVQNADLELDLRKEFTTIDIPQPAKSWLENFFPDRAELHDAEVIRANVRILSEGGEYVVQGSQVSLNKEDFGYRAELEGGELSFPFPVLKEATLEQASMRLINQRLVIDRAQFDVFASGNLGVDGEIDFTTGDYSFYGVLTGLKCADVITEDWKQRLSGEVEAKFTVKPKLGNEPEFRGEIFIQDGQLTALPVLDTIAAYTVIRDFKRLRFSELRCKFYCYGELFRLTDIYVHCDDLMRIEGALDMRGHALDGTFKVGLNPGTLSHIPGAEEKVFLPGKEGMHWADVKIGGSVEDIEEDLTERLKATALDHIFEVVGGKRVIRFTNQAAETLGELPKNLAEEGVMGVLKDRRGRVIQSGRDMIDAGLEGDITESLKTGSDILQSRLGGLFGAPNADEEKEEEEE